MAAAVRERAEALAEERLLDLLLPRRPGEAFVSGTLEEVSPDASRDATREKLRAQLRAGKLDDRLDRDGRAAGRAHARGPPAARAWRRSGST